MSFEDRISLLQAKLSTSQAFLLCRPADIRYFTGFIILNPEEREAFFLVTPQSTTLLYPSFSPVTKLTGIEYHPGHWPSDLEKVLTEKIESEKITELLADTSSLFVDEYQQLENVAGIRLSSLDREIVWNIRLKKDADEVAALTKANKITQQVMAELQTKVAVGVTEVQLAAECESLFKKYGCNQLAFPPVIAFGSHTALPHHQPTNTVLKKEMAVLFDIGGRVDGYCGDMTRTWWFGDVIPEEFAKLEKIVMEAYEAGLQVVGADCASDEIDQKARNIIDKAGYGKYFIHTTGHGVGLEIHEQPSVYFKKKVLLPEHAVFTIEPGIYLEGKFGYRYENTILIEANMAKELTK